MKTIPNYATYAAQHIYTVNIPGCTGTGKVFVGQRKDPFAVNLGVIFDLLNVPGAADFSPAEAAVDPRPDGEHAQGEQAGPVHEVLGGLGEQVVETRVGRAEAQGHSELLVNGTEPGDMLGPRHLIRLTAPFPNTPEGYRIEP